jgi:hypothetical protein
MMVTSQSMELTGIENMSPVRKYQIMRHAENPHYVASPSPFREYPLPLSPEKTVIMSNTKDTPIQRQSPLSTIKTLLGENDVFAISPGMFRRKTKRVDYLDIFADAERTEFVSPVKPTLTSPPSQGSAVCTTDELSNLSNDAPESTEHSSPNLGKNTEAEGTLQLSIALTIVEASTSETTEGDHPHLELLSYLARVASSSDHLPQDARLGEDGFEGGSIEDVLTAAALAESLKDELFSAVDEGEGTTVVEKDVSERIAPGEAVTIQRELTTIVNSVLDTSTAQNEQLEFKSTPNLPDIRDAAIDNETTAMNSAPSVYQEDTTIIGDEGHAEGEQDEIPDWDSLISFSEADDTALLDAEPAHDMQIPLGPSIKYATEEMNSQEMDADEDLSVTVPHQYAVNTVPTLDGLDGTGRVVDKDIQIFEDAPMDDIHVQTASARQSLDNNSVIFSFPKEQTLVTSPPKRPVSEFNQQDNVLPI